MLRFDGSSRPPTLLDALTRRAALQRDSTAYTFLVDGELYVAALFACLGSGFIAVPAYAPDLAGNLGGLCGILRSAMPRIGITTRATLAAGHEFFADAPEFAQLHWLTVDEMSSGVGAEWHRPDIDEEDVAMVVYTSGSTNEPKGVALAHRNLPHPPVDEAHAASRHGHHMLSWAAPHTAAGIFGGLVAPVSDGVPVILMLPEAVWEQPARSRM